MQWPEIFKPSEGGTDTEDRREGSNVQTGKDIGSEFFFHISVH